MSSWARSSDWESAGFASRRPRVQIPVSPFNFYMKTVKLFLVEVMFICAAYI